MARFGSGGRLSSILRLTYCAKVLRSSGSIGMTRLNENSCSDVMPSKRVLQHLLIKVAIAWAIIKMMVRINDDLRSIKDGL